VKRLFKVLRMFYITLPNDARTALAALMLSSAVMSAALFSAYYILPAPESESTPVETPQKCGLEPYVAAEDAISASAEAIECATSDDLEAELLARAIDAVVPRAEYAVRVSFGAVLLNRVKSSDFPSSLSGVIRSSGINISSSQGELPERTLHAARDALLGVDPTIGALYVMSRYDSRFPEFKERVCAVYGEYAFIK